MTVRIDSATSPIRDHGGEELTIVGEFPVGMDLGVTLGGELCYGGFGRADAPRSPDGLVIVCMAPAVPKGSRLLVVTAGLESDNLTITVVERDWPVKLHRIRRSCPPWCDVGPRSLEGERKR
jgi:hypothetical protein